MQNMKNNYQSLRALIKAAFRFEHKDKKKERAQKALKRKPKTLAQIKAGSNHAQVLAHRAQTKAKHKRFKMN